jgi:acetyl esterase/lipase
VIGDGRDADTAQLAKTLLKHAGVTHVFAPNYRLSVVPTGRFPAAFQDAVTSYYYLIKTLKIPASKITFSGDSAGGNLSLALHRYIVEYASEIDLPEPACSWLWSPWLDIEASKDPQTLLTAKNYHTDYLDQSFTTWGSRSFAPLGKGFNPEDPYVSPLHSPFKAKTAFWVHTGDAEVLYFDDAEFANELKSVGNKVELVVDHGVPHDILLVGHLLGFTQQAAAAAKKAGEFLRANRLTQ